MREHVFTVAINCVSRGLILRDRLCGWPLRLSAAVESDASVVRHRIPSDGNALDAVFVRPAGPAKARVLICHGIGETVEHWLGAQRVLAQCDVASLVFNYSGYGRSTGRINADQCERDAIAAFHFLQRLMSSEPVSLLGFSLGSGIATAILGRVTADRLVLCAAFTSLREAACSIGVPYRLACLLPAIWNTKEALRTCPVPVLIVQGQNDRLFPAQMARDLAGVCEALCELILVPELSHNDPFYRPHLSYWSSVTEWLRAVPR